MQYSYVHPVAGIGPRRGQSSWYALRENYQSGGINGRRVKNALELAEHEPKRAVQEIDKLTKKFGVCTQFLACRALAISRMKCGNFDRELVEAISRAIDRTEMDEFSIMCVIHLLQHEVGDYQMLHSYLQTLLPAAKGNVKMLESIQMIYFRHHNAKEMQKIAIGLSIFNIEKHTKLAVTSLIIQALDCSDLKQRSNMLVLASKTLEKRLGIPEKPCDDFAVRLWIALKTENVDAIMNLIKGVFSDDYHTAFRIRELRTTLVKCCRVLAKKARFQEAETLLNAALKDNLEPELLDALIALKVNQIQKALPLSDRDGFVSMVEEASSELLKTVETKSARKEVATLAKSIFLQSLHEIDSVPPEYLKEVVQPRLLAVLERYFVQSGNRPSFFSDIHGSLLLLNQGSLAQLIESIDSQCKVALEMAREGRDMKGVGLGRLIEVQNRNLLSVASRKAGENSLEDLQKQSAEMFAFRKLAVDSLGEEGNATGGKAHSYFDTSALLGLHLLFDCFKSTGESAYLMDIITILEALVAKPAPLVNPIFRILLIQTYIMCGAFTLILSQVRAMDLKSLQLQHLSHLLEPLMHMSIPNESLAIVDEMLRFFTSNVFDLYDAQCGAINREHHFDVVQLELLKHRLKHSTMYVLAGFVRPWNVLYTRPLPPWEANRWISDLDRFSGPHHGELAVDMNDRAVPPSCNLELDKDEEKSAESRKQEQVFWASLLRCQTMLFSACSSLTSGYSAFNPFDERDARVQLSEVFTTVEVDLVMDGVGLVDRAYDDYFDAAKRIGTLQTTFEEKSFKISCPPIYVFYRHLGCQAIHMRLGRFVALVEAVLSSTVAHFGGKALHPVSEEKEDKEGAAEGENGAAEKKDKDPTRAFIEAIFACEFAHKLRQMQFVIFSDFEMEGKALPLKFRDLILQVWLLLQSARSLGWILRSLTKSLVTLRKNISEAAVNKTAQSADFKKVLDEWLKDWMDFVKDIAEPLRELRDRLRLEAEIVRSKEMEESLVAHSAVLKSLKLANDEPNDLVPIVKKVSVDLRRSWEESLGDLGATTTACIDVLEECIVETESVLTSGAKSGRKTE